MKATAQTIWQIPAYLPYLQPPLTTELIISAEQVLGYKLPLEFLDLLRIQNGGYIRFTLPDRCHELIRGIGLNYPSLTDFDWDDFQDNVSFPLHGLVPFDGDGHWFLCLDYRAGAKSPTITYIDTECDHQLPLADSFAAYLSLLAIDLEEDQYVLPSVPKLEDFKSLLSSSLGLVLEPPDSNGYGYPSTRARGGTEKEPAWLWFSPNMAPRGFVRPEDKRFGELRHLLPGSAPRYPHLPAASYLLSMTPNLKASVIALCQKHAIEIRSSTEFAS